MTKQPTRLANFDIPREQAAKADGQPEGDLVPKASPTPAFLQPEVHAVLRDAQPGAPLAEPPTPPLVQVAPPAPTLFPQPKAPAPEEPRRQLAARVRLSIAERLRIFLFVERESQQDAVEAALDAYLKEKGY